MANIQFKTKIAVVLVLVCAGMLAGCGSSSSSSTPKPGSGPLTGNWQFLLTNTNVSNPPITKQAGFLSQTGKQVDGTLTFQSSKCSGSGPVSGTSDGKTVSLIANQPGLDVNLTGAPGTESLDGTGTLVCTPGNSSSGSACLSGTYNLIARGCGKSESGTWNAFQMQPLTQTLSGTFTDNSTGTPTTMSATLQQGSASDTSATLTGTLTPAVPAGRACVVPNGETSAVLTGQISGNSVILGTILGPDNTVGTVKGQIVAVWYPLGNANFGEPVLDFSNTPQISRGTAYNFSQFTACNPRTVSGCSADVNNPICVVDPTCVPDPINPDNCPGPTNTQCTGIRIQGCESGLGTLCKSGAC